MERTFRPCQLDQLLLLPPASQDWLPADHVVFSLSDLVGYAVEGSHQVIVACTVMNQANDAPHGVPLADAVTANTGEAPQRLLGDAGSRSEASVRSLTVQRIEPPIAPGKVQHGPAPPSPCGRMSKHLGLRERMQRKPGTTPGRSFYARRRVRTEPALGLIKHVRGFRQFLLRGLAKVQAQRALICTGHNLLTLWRCRRWAAA
jgi:hypothetical protein